VQDTTKLEATNRRRNQSKNTRKISRANKYPEVTEKILHWCTSTSNAASHYCF